MFKLQSVKELRTFKTSKSHPDFYFFYHFCSPEFADSKSMIKNHLFFEVTEKFAGINSSYIYIFERNL